MGLRLRIIGSWGHGPGSPKTRKVRKSRAKAPDVPAVEPQPEVVSKPGERNGKARSVTTRGIPKTSRSVERRLAAQARARAEAEANPPPRPPPQPPNRAVMLDFLRDRGFTQALSLGRYNTKRIAAWAREQGFEG